jgi:hypothetical protein
VVGAILLGLLAFVWYPVKRLIAWRARPRAGGGLAGGDRAALVLAGALLATLHLVRRWGVLRRFAALGLAAGALRVLRRRRASDLLEGTRRAAAGHPPDGPFARGRGRTGPGRPAAGTGAGGAAAGRADHCGLA